MDSTPVDNNCSRINRAQLEYSPVEALNNHREKSCMQNLSFIKPQMIRQVLPFRDEARNRTCHGGSQVVMESSAPMIMELFPQSTGFAASISGAARQKSPASKFIQETVLTPASVQSQEWSFLSHGSVQNSVIYRPASAMAPASKSTTTPLTIFYNGSVNVYDVAPEKAQAIMILARSAISNCKGSSSPTITYSGPSSSKFSSIEGPTEPFTGVAAQQRAVCKLNSVERYCRTPHCEEPVLAAFSGEAERESEWYESLHNEGYPDGNAWTLHFVSLTVHLYNLGIHSER